ncbi:MAG: DUF2061 domain-containing protein [Candidatus Omnitrophota bacterium]
MKSIVHTEQPKRSIMKAVSWRFFGCISTIVIVYIYTQDAGQALKVGVGVDAVKIVFYYIHERLWDKVKFGRKKQDYQI